MVDRLLQPVGPADRTLLQAALPATAVAIGPFPAALGASHIMVKSFCLAAGIFACVVGVEMLLIDSAVVLPLHGGGQPRMFTAPDWAPWTLLSAGAVTILQFARLPGRGAVGHE